MKRSSQHARRNSKSFAVWALMALTFPLITIPVAADRSAPEKAAPARAPRRAPGNLLADARYALFGSPRSVELAATINVNSTAQSPGASGDCTLGEAIQAANTDAAVDGCSAGSGTDTIMVPAGTYTLTTVDNNILFVGATGLTGITTDVIIQGAGFATTIIERDPLATANFRLLAISNQNVGSLVLNDVTMRGGRSVDEGGALYLYCRPATINRVVFDDNAASAGGATGGYNGTDCGAITVNDSTFTNNRAQSSHGGAIAAHSATVLRSSFTANSSLGHGGAIDGSFVLNITASSFTNNSATGGSSVGGALRTGLTNTISGSTFIGNTSGNESGAIAASGTVNISDSVVVNNSARAVGGIGAGSFSGGVSPQTLTIDRCNISNNAATESSVGGVLVLGGNVNISNSTLSGNSANTNSGGIESVSGTLTIINSTITNNRADNDNNGSGAGGGIFRSGGTVTLRNTIVAGNFNDAGPSTTRDDVNGTLDGAGSFNLIGDGTGMSGIMNGSNGNQVGTSGSPIDPLLDTLQNNGGPTSTHALLYNSPAIDAGDDCVVLPSGGGGCLTAPLTTDQRGLPRQVDGDLTLGAVVDIGAYERQDPEIRNVPAGSDVNVDLNDAQLTFSSVTVAATAAIEVLDPDAQGSPPPGYSIGTHPQPPGCASNPSQAQCLPAFDVSTTASYTGSVGICFYLPSITDQSFFAGLKVLHNEGGVLVDRTTGQNFAGKIVCGSVPTLSPFVIAHSATPTATSGSVSGRIVASNGNPVEGAGVRMNGTQNRLTVTDALGRYRFDNVETNGFYTVTPSRVNYNFNPFNRSFTQLGNHTEAAFGASFTGDAANPLDTPEYFVRQQYVDILGREPDEGGFNYWSDRILECGSNEECLNTRRREVAAAFFIEREFQDSGSFIYDTYKSALGRQPVFAEYSSDRRQVVGGANLEAEKTAFAESFVLRAEFGQRYQSHTTAESFVDALIHNVQQASGVDLGSARATLINKYNTGLNQTQSRGLVLRDVADNAALKQAEYNASFVLTEYFGYLRRDPDPGGYTFWLDVLNNRDPGNFRGMVCSFITSTEYQKRFSAIVTHTNAECGP